MLIIVPLDPDLEIRDIDLGCSLFTPRNKRAQWLTSIVNSTAFLTQLVKSLRLTGCDGTTTWRLLSLYYTQYPRGSSKKIISRGHDYHNASYLREWWQWRGWFIVRSYQGARGQRIVLLMIIERVLFSSLWWSPKCTRFSVSLVGYLCLQGKNKCPKPHPNTHANQHAVLLRHTILLILLTCCCRGMERYAQVCYCSWDC